MDSLRFSAQSYRKVLVIVAVMGVLSLGFPSAQAENVLLNPGFETDAAMGQEPVPVVTDWQTFNTGEKNTVSSPGNPVRTGIGSLQLVGLGGFGVPLALQTFDAAEGQIWDLQAYLRVEDALTAGSRALIKIVFRDVDAGLDLQPASVNIGVPDPDANFPGVIPNPQVTSTTAVGQWHLLRAQGVAPPNTDQVTFFALLVDETPGTVYFDDYLAELVEEQPQPGDFDNDGQVDGLDLDVWQGAFGSTGAADADGDGDSDGADFLVWQRNVGAGLVSAVPEPATTVLVAGLALCVVARRRQRAA